MSALVLLLVTYLVLKPLLEPCVSKIGAYVSSYLSGMKSDVYTSNTRSRIDRIRQQYPRARYFLISPQGNQISEILLDENTRPKDGSFTTIVCEESKFIHITLFIYSIVIILEPTNESMRIFSKIFPEKERN